MHEILQNFHASVSGCFGRLGSSQFLSENWGLKMVVVPNMNCHNEDGHLLPVSYFSRKLMERKRSGQVFDLDLLDIVLAFEEWRAWLMGTSSPVKVYSDHSNFLYFKTAKYLSPKQARWAPFLDMFNMLIFHIAGARNPADAPSRHEDYRGDMKLRSETSILVEC
jgi:hypothetical protein